jgi:hypothetical protein
MSRDRTLLQKNRASLFFGTRFVVKSSHIYLLVSGLYLSHYSKQEINIIEMSCECRVKSPQMSWTIDRPIRKLPQTKKGGLNETT